MLNRDLPLNSETIQRLISPFYLAILLSLFLTASGSSITLLNTPSLLCEQDTVQFSCTVTSPGFIYESSNAGLNINSSINCVSAGQIGAGTVPRLSVMSTGGTSSAPSAQYTISPFLLQDNMTQYRCCANNASNFVQDFTDFISLLLAATPSAPTNLMISSAYDSDTSCTGTITLTWLAVTSDRNVTSYEVLLNGTVDGTTGTTTYTTGTLNLLEHYATYTVMATSCAGSSTSSPVMFTPLTPALPSPPTITNISSTYDSATSCTGTITLTWPAVASDRAVTSYEVLLNGTTFSTITTSIAMNSYTTGSLNLLEHYATYTVMATSCAGSSTSSPVMFTALTPASPSAASISISTTYDSATSCTGTITLTWPAVASDRNVTSYEVLLNGTANAITTPMGMNSYTTGTLNLLEHYATYTVMATSCAGSSMASFPVMFMPPDPPNPFTPNINCTRLNQLQAELNISLPAIITDRPITHYTLYINNKIENNKSADGSNYEYSTMLQLSSYSNLNITTIAYSCAGFYSNIAITNICVGDDVPLALPTGAIVGIVVGGICFIIIAIAVILLCCILIYFAIKRKTRSDQEERKK